MSAPDPPSAPQILRALESTVGGLPGTFWVLWGGTLINRVGGFVLPFLTMYLTQERHLTLEQAGLVGSLFGAGALIASFLGGALADRIGRRATMLLGLTATSAAVVLLGLARSIEEIAAATLLLGLVNDLYRPAVSAAVVDLVPPEHRLRAFGLLYWAINLGFAIAPVLAGVLSARGYFLLFILDAATTLAYAALVWLKVPETRPASDPRAGGISAIGLLAPFGDLAFLPFWVASLAIALVFHQFTIALPAAVTDAGLTSRDYGLAIAVNGMLIVLVQPFASRFVGSMRRGRTLAVASALVGLGMGVTHFAETLPAFALSVAIWTLGEIVMTPANSTIVGDLAPAEMRGRYQGAFTMAWGVSMLLAPAIGGKVYSALGSGWVWGGCAVIGALSALAHLAIAPARQARLCALHGDAYPVRE